MSVRMRHTSGHTKNRRSHHAIKGPQLAKCTDCGEQHLMHRVCQNCGKYRGRVVIDMEKQIAKKEEKTKRRQKELESSGVKTKSNKGTDQTEQSPKEIGAPSKNTEAVKPLNPQQLSK